MKVTPTSEVLIIEPKIFSDNREFFFESFNLRAFEESAGVRGGGQDNHSMSDNKVLRGLHYQIQQPQGKFVRVVAGKAFDVAVNIRKSSKTFGRGAGVHLSAENKKQLWLLKGFAHNSVALSNCSELQHKTSDYYAPEYERSLLRSDPTLGIDWPIEGEPKLAAKDANANRLPEAEVFS